jgi:hypothetical protein
MSPQPEGGISSGQNANRQRVSDDHRGAPRIWPIKGKLSNRSALETFISAPWCSSAAFARCFQAIKITFLRQRRI